MADVRADRPCDLRIDLNEDGAVSCADARTLLKL
jgi:hypothetical protein